MRQYDGGGERNSQINRRWQMNWAEMKADWNELKTMVQAHWPQLSNLVLRDIDGDRAELARAIQRHYGFSARRSSWSILVCRA
jgi:hypothetical protein